MMFDHHNTVRTTVPQCHQREYTQMTMHEPVQQFRTSPEPKQTTPKRRTVNFHSIADLARSGNETAPEPRGQVSPSLPRAVTPVARIQTSTPEMTYPSPAKSTTSSVDSGRVSPANASAVSSSPCSSPSSDSARGSPTPDDSVSSRGKKTRTIFKPHQVVVLEQMFLRCQYPESDVIERLASQLDTKEAKIKVWFQNKRARWRKRPVDSTASSHIDQSPWLPGVMSPMPYQHNFPACPPAFGASHPPVHPMYQQQYLMSMMAYPPQMTPRVGHTSPVNYGPHAQMLQNASNAHFARAPSHAMRPAFR